MKRNVPACVLVSFALMWWRGLTCSGGAARAAPPFSRFSLIITVRRRPEPAEHGTPSWVRLYFGGYVTAHPRHYANSSSTLAKLSPTPTVRRRTPIALRGTAPLRSSCFAHLNQDARCLPEYVKGASCELRHETV